MEDVSQIVKDIKDKKIAPIYFLTGDEPYYIDQLADFMQHNILTEEEKGFNQMVLYGRDVSIDEIVSHAKRFPMMAEKQVIIVKEAQDLSRSIDQLEGYINNPQPTTVLVFCYKYKTLDKRKKVYKSLQKNGIYFESKQIKDWKVGDWIKRVLSGKGYKIDPVACNMLVEFLGNDLGKINNELEKLRLIIPKGVTITPNDIEKNIGISKDFNNFELRKAIGERNKAKALLIINHFSANPKEHPVVLTVGMLFNYFVQIMQYHGLRDKSTSNVMKQLKIGNTYFINEYETAAKNYPMKKVSQILTQFRKTDLHSKGVNAHNLSQSDLLKDLLIAVF